MQHISNDHEDRPNNYRNCKISPFLQIKDTLSRVYPRNSLRNFPSIFIPIPQKVKLFQTPPALLLIITDFYYCIITGYAFFEDAIFYNH